MINNPKKIKILCKIELQNYFFVIQYHLFTSAFKPSKQVNHTFATVAINASKLRIRNIYEQRI